MDDDLIDPVQLLLIERGLDSLLRMVVDDVPDALAAKNEIAVLGKALADFELTIGDVIKRVVALDASKVERRTFALHEAFGMEPPRRCPW